MDCLALERSYEAYLDGEFADEDRLDADGHLAHCDPCRKLVDSQRHLRQAVKAKLRAAMGASSGGASEALRNRIESVLAAERQPLWRRAISPVPLATVAACAAGAMVVLMAQHGPDPLIEDAVRKHARDLPMEVTAASGADLETVAAWFKGKVDFNPRPPKLDRARLVGARLSHIKDRPAAYMRYELPQGHRASLFIIEDPDRHYGEGAKPMRYGGANVGLINSAGYNVAVWRENEIVYSLVSDLGERDLAQIVQAAQASFEAR